jgi:hypothetical protein
VTPDGEAAAQTRAGWLGKGIRTWGFSEGRGPEPVRGSQAAARRRQTTG